MTHRHIEFASAVLIDTRGHLILQERDNIPGIYLPGQIGLFGGHREEGESFLQCVVREIQEEIGYFVPPGRFQHLTSYAGFVDSDGDTAYGEIFIADDIPFDGLHVTEGSLLIVPRTEISAIEHRLSPSASAALKALPGNSSHRQRLRG